MSEAMERDHVIERVRTTLRASPAAEPDARAVARVLAAQPPACPPTAFLWRDFVPGYPLGEPPFSDSV